MNILNMAFNFFIFLNCYQKFVKPLQKLSNLQITQYICFGIRTARKSAGCICHLNFFTSTETVYHASKKLEHLWKFEYSICSWLEISP